MVIQATGYGDTVSMDLSTVHLHLIILCQFSVRIVSDWTWQGLDSVLVVLHHFQLFNPLVFHSTYTYLPFCLFESRRSIQVNCYGDALRHHIISAFALDRDNPGKTSQKVWSLREKH